MANLRVNKIAAPIVKDEFTGSVFFDGTGDNLVSKSSGLAPGSGNFTAEGWFNLPSTSGISNSSLFSSGIEPVLHWALIVDTGGSVVAAQPEPDTWNRIDVGFGTYVAGFLVQKSNERVLFDVGINTTSATLDFSTPINADFYYPAFLVSNDFVNNGWINKGAVNTDSDGVVTLTDSTPFRYIKMWSLTNYGGVNSTYAGIATLQGYSPLDGADYDAWGVRRSSGNGNAYLYNGGDWVDSGLSVSQDTWNHIAVVRDSDAMNLYVNGVGYALTSYSNSNLSNSVLSVSGFNTSGNVVVDPLRGYASNVRLTLGEKLYTSNFAPPTTELEVIGGTAFVGCYDGENIFAEKTGKVIAAYGDRLSSPTPTATDSPIGITTFNPGLTRSVDATAGPTFQGGAGFVSQNWLTLPKGTTTDRNRTGGRGLFGGGQSPSRTTTIEFVTISSMGNAQDFGDLTDSRFQLGSCGSSTRGLFAGGEAVAKINIIDYVTIASTGNAVNFGDLIEPLEKLRNGLSNNTRGIFGGGGAPGGLTNIINYVTILTLGDALDFGDLLRGKADMAAASSPVRGLFFNTALAIANTEISYITIASTGNALDFGDLTTARSSAAASSSSTRALIFGGSIPGNYTNSIEYVTIPTLGNASDFGDLNEIASEKAGTSNSIRGIVIGGYTSGGNLNRIDYVTIQTTGNTKDFGDISSGTDEGAACSDSHGGLS